LSSKQKRWAAAAAILVVLAAAGAAVLFVIRARGTPAAIVETKPAEPPTEIVLPARLAAKNVVEIPAPIEGRVEQFHVDVGEEVSEGELIAVIRSQRLQTDMEAAQIDLERVQTRVSNLESEISAARLESSRATADATRVRADLDRASRTYQREKMLLAEGATPRLKFEKAQRDFAALEQESKTLDQVARQAEERVAALNLELDTARKILQDKTDDFEASKGRIAAGEVLSPATGIVVSRRGTAGDDVHPSMTDLFRIATDVSVMEALADADPGQLALIREGQAAFVAIAETQDVLPGTVIGVRDGKVIIEFANPNPTIRPGVPVQVRIKLT
jgi:multidrug efflux pump subunit AcrA (membrane-fusion protein)